MCRSTLTIVFQPFPSNERMVRTFEAGASSSFYLVYWVPTEKFCTIRGSDSI